MDSPAPKDRSIFRKNIGRDLLNREKDPYLECWEADFTISAERAIRINAILQKKRNSKLKSRGFWEQISDLDLSFLMTNRKERVQKVWKAIW